VFTDMSKDLNSTLQIFSIFCISSTDIVSRRISSAYMNTLKHRLWIKHPRQELFNFTRTSLIKTANKFGERTPPCRVPEINFTIDEKQFPYFTQAYTYENQHSNMATRAIGEFLCNSLINKAYLFILLNAFFKSIPTMLTVEPRSMKKINCFPNSVYCMIATNFRLKTKLPVGCRKIITK